VAAAATEAPSSRRRSCSPRADDDAQELLESDDKFGFIVMDGNGCLFGTLAGNHREVLHKFSVDLPKKHGRGGQSALRFARLRLEKRHNYVRKVAEVSAQMFISADKVNVTGIVLAGSADFKNDLAGSDIFDQRLVAKIMKTVDVSYGGENGFNQAIELSAETLSNVKFVQEKKLISKYFDEISQDTGKFCFGIDDTLKGLEMGAVRAPAATPARAPPRPQPPIPPPSRARWRRSSCGRTSRRCGTRSRTLSRARRSSS